jgi:hypothetical protein
LTDLTNGFIQLLAEREGAKWHNGVPVMKATKKTKDIAHRIPKYFRM